jgi:hypothetical protein
MAGHQEINEGKPHPVNDVDQTAVTVRPKHNIGSSGSVGGSETMLLRWEVPQLFGAKEGPYQYSSIPLRRLCVHIHDFLFYFNETTMKEDVMAITPSSDWKFREYEMSRVVWLEKQLSSALLRWEEDKPVYCFRVFGPLMKHEKRVVYITSQTKTFHWLFNLLSVIKILIVVF